MGQKLDRIMYDISVIYIALPVFIFLAGWLRLIVAVPVCIVFLISLLLMLRNRPEPVAWHLTKAQLGVVLASLVLLAIWVFLSGQGGYTFQNSDYQCRNAIFHDLIERSWPVVYDYSKQNAAAGLSIAGSSNFAVLTYYIAFWLPGALVGKLFGWYAANAFLYFWSLLGVVLITYYLFRTLRNTNIWSVLILIFFSGLDVIGYYLSKWTLPGPFEHIEWWSGFQYSSNTTLLFWVFNQTITIWLAILLIMNLKNSRSLFFLYALLLLHGPFPFLGMLPIVLWKAYQGFPLDFRKKNEQRINVVRIFFLWFWNGIRRALTFENIFGGISVLLIIYMYLSNNISAGTTGMNALTTNYYFFIVFDCGFFLLFLCAEHRKKPLYWICLGSLLLIPFFRVGTSQDFCMRVSIPALFMIQIMVQQTLLGKSDQKTDSKIPAHPGKRQMTGREKKIIRIALAVCLVIGMVVPLQEMSRSVYLTLPPNNITWADTTKTLGNDMKSFENFLGSVTDNLFYEYLARQ